MSHQIVIGPTQGRWMERCPCRPGRQNTITRGRHGLGRHLAVREQQVGTIRPPRPGRRLQQGACPGAGQRPAASRIRRHSSEEIYVRVSRHARHGRLTFPALRAKNRHKRRRTARPRRRSRANRTTATLSRTSSTQLHHQHHAVAPPAARSGTTSTTQLHQFEMAGPPSGCGAWPQQYGPSHVFGAVKSRGVLTPADSIR
jgi:hypothetical protein